MTSHCAVSVNSRVSVTLEIRSCKKEVSVPLDFFFQGQRRSSLYCLLAGSEDDEPAEWSDSMATPPLKIVSPSTAAGRRVCFEVLMIPDINSTRH